MAYIDELRAQVKNHPLTDECPDQECLVCGIRDCPHGEPLHYHHDGCPSCYEDHKDELRPVDEDIGKRFLDVSDL